MSKLRKERWKILKHVFENLKQVAETEGNSLFYDGSKCSDWEIIINDECMECGLYYNNCTWLIYTDSEEDARTSATTILERIKERVKVYQLTNIW